jgi:cell division protein FtsZ
MADDVLHSGVRGVTDLMVMPGLINLDFADIRAIMTEMGKAQMGTGEAEGEKRAIKAAEAAISNPLLDDVSMRGARGVLINITGGSDMTLFEVDEAANRIREEVDPEANIIFGSTCDGELEGRIRVSVVATGIEANAAVAPKPQPVTLFAEYRRPQPAPAQRMQPAMAPPAPAAAVVRGAPVIGRAQAVAAAPVPQLRSESQSELILAREVPESAGHAEPETAASAARETASSFVPSRPAQPALSREPMRAPEPFAAAAMANGGQYPARDAARGPNLIQRVTGTGWARRPAESRPAAEPILAEPKISGLDRVEPAAAGPSEDDILDIPAFLRRQAN